MNEAVLVLNTWKHVPLPVRHPPHARSRFESPATHFTAVESAPGALEQMQWLPTWARTKGAAARSNVSLKMPAT